MKLKITNLCFLVLIFLSFQNYAVAKSTDYPELLIDQEISGDLSVEEPYEFTVDKKRTVFICIKSNAELGLTKEATVHIQGTGYNTLHNFTVISSFPKVWGQKLEPGDYLVYLRGTTSGPYDLKVSYTDPRVPVMSVEKDAQSPTPEPTIASVLTPTPTPSPTPAPTAAPKDINQQAEEGAMKAGIVVKIIVLVACLILFIFVINKVSKIEDMNNVKKIIVNTVIGIIIAIVAGIILSLL